MNEKNSTDHFIAFPIHFHTLAMEMQKKIKLVLLFTWMLLWAQQFSAQNKMIDSLSSLIKNEKEDLKKINHLNALSWEYLKLGYADSAISLSDRAITISNSLPKPEQVKKNAISFANLAMAHANKGDFAVSLTWFFKALKIAEELDDKNSIASNLGNIGNVYGNIGEYDKSIEYFSKALKIAQEMGDKKTIANNLGNLGNLYDYKNDSQKALEFYFKALEIQREINNKSGIGSNLGNIGLVYNNLGEKEKAITYYFQALAISEQSGDQRGITVWLGNIGQLYKEMMQNASLKEKKDLGSKAESYLLKALAIDTTIGFLHHAENTHLELSELYSAMGDYKKSLLHYKSFTFAKDSLFNEEKNKEITRNEMNYEFEKKEAVLKAEQDKREAVAEADKKKQNIFFWLLSSVAIAIAIIAIVVFRSLNITRKQKQIIEQQKEIVEEKQLEILDSIHYAKRIQQSLLPTEKYIDKNLNRLKHK